MINFGILCMASVKSTQNVIFTISCVYLHVHFGTGREKLRRQVGESIQADSMQCCLAIAILWHHTKIRVRCVIETTAQSDDSSSIHTDNTTTHQILYIHAHLGIDVAARRDQLRYLIAIWRR